jgi:hypothetical protein
MYDRKIEPLDEDECLRLISPGGIGRIAYQSRFGLAVLPVNYQLRDGAIVFRTAEHSPLDEDLRTGIADAEYKVAFEIDEFDLTAKSGWSVLLQGSAHHITPGPERDSAEAIDVDPWPAGDRELFVSITPTRTTGRRIARPSGSITLLASLERVDCACDPVLRMSKPSGRSGSGRCSSGPESAAAAAVSGKVLA